MFMRCRTYTQQLLTSMITPYELRTNTWSYLASVIYDTCKALALLTLVAHDHHSTGESNAVKRVTESRESKTALSATVQCRPTDQPP